MDIWQNSVRGPAHQGLYRQNADIIHPQNGRWTHNTNVWMIEISICLVSWPLFWATLLLCLTILYASKARSEMYSFQSSTCVRLIVWCFQDFHFLQHHLHQPQVTVKAMFLQTITPLHPADTCDSSTVVQHDCLYPQTARRHQHQTGSQYRHHSLAISQ